MYVAGKEAERRLGVCGNTLRLWAKSGKIEVSRKAGTYRRYNVEKYLQNLQVNTQAAPPTTGKTKIAYCRVSSAKQADDLGRQVAYLTARYPTHKVITDIGSGLNFKRKGLWSILESVMRGDVEEVVVSYTDRLARFGYQLIERILTYHHTKLVVENSKEYASDEQELAEDLLSIVHVFSCRVNGKRRYSKRKRSEEKNERAGGEKSNERRRTNNTEDSKEEDVQRVH
jgi:predicted site-specific integrase-resolvase